MKSVRIKLLLAVATAGVLVAVGTVAGADGGNKFKGRLTGYQEVPALSTTGAGEFRARLARDGQSMTYELSFGETETTVTQSHIHFENATNNGTVVVFLCTNLNNSPVAVQDVSRPPARSPARSLPATSSRLPAGPRSA